MASESELVASARAGDRAALDELLRDWRKPLFAYIFRMTTHRADAEDLLQDVLVRVLQSLPSFRGEARFKTWVFGIATHVCLDHLRRKQRWRLEAQLIAEEETTNSPERMQGLETAMAQPDFAFETREHIAFCFACVARTLPPEEQAALMLKEVLGFTAEEAALILEVSEPVFRHRLSAARASMAQNFDGLCSLINKTGRCYQCSGLREMTPAGHQGEELVQIVVAPGVAVSADSLLDARLQIVRHADLEDGRTAKLHAGFFAGITAREDSR